MAADTVPHSSVWHSISESRYFWGHSSAASPVTVTVYSTVYSRRGSPEVSRSARGFAPGLPGARRRPSRHSSAAIHSGAPSSRRMVGARSIRAVVAGSAEAARSGKIRDQRAQRRHDRQLVILACKMGAGLDHGQSSARLTSPATTGLSAM